MNILSDPLALSMVVKEQYQQALQHIKGERSGKPQTHVPPLNVN